MSEAGGAGAYRGRAISSGIRLQWLGTKLVECFPAAYELFVRARERPRWASRHVARQLGVSLPWFDRAGAAASGHVHACRGACERREKRCGSYNRRAARNVTSTSPEWQLLGSIKRSDEQLELANAERAGFVIRVESKLVQSVVDENGQCLFLRAGFQPQLRRSLVFHECLAGAFPEELRRRRRMRGVLELYLNRTACTNRGLFEREHDLRIGSCCHAATVSLPVDLIRVCRCGRHRYGDGGPPQGTTSYSPDDDTVRIGCNRPISRARFNP